MKEFFGSILHLSLLFAAYLVARADGYISAKEIDIPMYVNFAFWVASFMLIAIYEITGSKTKKDDEE